MATIEEILHDVPVFAGMTDEELGMMAGCGGNVHFAEGERLFRQDDPADTFYVLRQGSVALETFVPARGPLTIDTIEAGDVVGWSWLFAPYRWHFDARALVYTQQGKGIQRSTDGGDTWTKVSDLEPIGRVGQPRMEL